MKRLVLATALLATCLMVTGEVVSDHYYGGGEPIPLGIDTLFATIRFDLSIPVHQQQAILDSIDRIESVIEDDHAIDGFIVCSLSTGDGYHAFLDSLREMVSIDFAEPYYLNSLDSAFLVGIHFCVAFNEDVSRTAIDSINAQLGAEISHEVPGMPNVLVLTNTPAAGSGLVDLANSYYELAETRYAHPEFAVWPVKCAYKLYDHYSQYQLHIKKVIGQFNTASVWDFAGLDDTIVVAVVDDGADVHEDLPLERLLAGYDFADGDPDPSPGDSAAHGMGCAGIIGASHARDSSLSHLTSTGVFSMTDDAVILPVKIFDDKGSGAGVEPSDIAAAITYAYTNGAQLLSNSWGYAFSGPGGDEFDVLTDALERATIFGRNGLGCPVIFSSGNGSPYIPGVLYPAWLPFVSSVGATDLNDQRWHYSSYGEGLDIVAPSGDYCLQGDVWTLDQMGNLGYNPDVASACGMSVTWNCPQGANDVDYGCHFGGTSAASPIVSGTAALLLAKDPNLTA